MNLVTFENYDRYRTRFSTPSPEPRQTSLGSEPKLPFNQIRVGSDSFIIVKPQFPNQSYRVKLSNNQTIDTGLTMMEDVKELDHILKSAFNGMSGVELGCDLLQQVITKIIGSHF